jgi:predicted HicB family RNase H-like nuclease
MTAKRAPKRALDKRAARINIRATPALRDALVDLARRDGRSLSAYVERVLDDHARSKSRGDNASKRNS